MGMPIPEGLPTPPQMTRKEMQEKKHLMMRGRRGRVLTSSRDIALAVAKAHEAFNPLLPSRATVQAARYFALTKGRTFTRIALDSGVPLTTVTRVLKGQREPGILTACRLAYGLEMTLDEFSRYWIKLFTTRAKVERPEEVAG